MNLQQLIERFRIEADDLAKPFLWADEWVAAWLSEAQDEAALRARLLLDDYTPAVTSIAVQAGVASYALHPKVYELPVVDFVPKAGQVENLGIVSREWLDSQCNGWRDDPSGVPRYAIQTDTRLRLVPTPSVDGALRIEAYRLPFKALINDTDKPEIHEAHHIHLIDWALYRAFGKPDADGHDPERSQKALKNFEAYFGMRQDADMRRSTRHDETQANVSYVL
jgi:hypothetical protein